MQKIHKSIQVFKNPYLERLTHVHPITPLLVWVPVVIGFLWHASSVLELGPIQIGTYGTLGFVSWTLAEYLLHRFVFHYEGDTAVAQRFHFLVHGLHHADPQDPTRLVMPPAASIILAIIFYYLFETVLGSIVVEPFFAFFIVGYLCYDYIHYSVHHFKMRTPIGRYLKQSHMQHHYVCPDAHMGVSSPLWDYVFGTMDGVKEKQRTI